MLRPFALAPARSGSAVLVLLGLGCLGFLACADVSSAELLRVDAVAPARIESDAIVAVAGHGFPVGQSATVVFDGMAYRPGATPVRRRAATTARALSTDRLTFPATDAWFRALGGRSTFVGTVTVTFDLPPHQARITGHLPIARVNLFPATVDDFDLLLERARTAEALAAHAGFELAHEHSADSGALIASVRPGSVAEQSGLLVGDRVLEADGVRVDAVTEVLPRPDSDTLELRIERSGEATPLAASLSLRGFLGRARLPWDTGRLTWLAATLLGVLMFFSPAGRLTSWIARAVTRELRFDRRPPALGEWFVGPAPWSAADRRVKRLWTLLTLSAGSLMFGATAFLGGVLGGDTDAGLILLALGVLRAIATPVRTDASAFARWRLVATGVLEPLLPLGLGLLALAVSTGFWGLRGFVHSQSGWPWQWNATNSPLGLLLIPATLIALAKIARSTPDPAAPGLLAAVACRAQLLLASALVAAVLLGGWNVPGSSGPTDSPTPLLFAAGAGLYAVKAWVAFALAIRLSAAARDPRTLDRRTWLVATPLAFGAVLLAAAFAVLGLPETARAAFGPLVGVALVVVAASIALRAWPRLARRWTSAPRVALFL